MCPQCLGTRPTLFGMEDPCSSNRIWSDYGISYVFSDFFNAVPCFPGIRGPGMTGNDAGYIVKYDSHEGVDLRVVLLPF